MREIKFRAYNKKCRCSSCGIFTSWERLLKTRYSGNFADNFFEDDDLLLEQFTGLKDKNGVEIYEGDVVNKYCTESNPDGYKQGDLIVQAPVVYIPNLCSFALQKGLSFRIEKQHDLEVIGNIHENPELLES